MKGEGKFIVSNQGKCEFLHKKKFVSIETRKIL